MLEWLGLPVAASAHAAEVDRIMVLIHWLMLVLFVGWSVFFVYVLVRFRSGANPQANYRGVKGRWSTWVEGGVLVAEIVLLAFFSIPFWRTNVDAAPPAGQATMLRVVAEQFAWYAHYPGADGVFGRTEIALVNPDNPLGLDRNEAVGKDDIIAINRMNLPVGKARGDHALEQGRHPQLRLAADAREAGRDSRDRPAGVVHAHTGRPLGYRVLTTVRARALPHEGDLRNPDAGRLRGVAEGRSRVPRQSLMRWPQAPDGRLKAAATRKDPMDVKDTARIASEPPENGTCRSRSGRARSIR